MGLYHFNLHDSSRVIQDSEGTDLPDDEAARAHATIVAREVMRNNTRNTLSWRLRVCNSERELCFELLFASVSEEFDHCGPQIRDAITEKSQSMASLQDNIDALRHTVNQVRTTLARIDGHPYLAAVNGRRVDC
jgi:hypothetical protein